LRDAKFFVSQTPVVDFVEQNSVFGNMGREKVEIFYERLIFK
jgi:hypothetical protein